MFLQKLISLAVVVCCFALSTRAQFPGEEFLGKASYYHQKFNFRKTASGAIFRNDGLTAAHRTLPFGSLVEVINPANNKSVIVTINDRGPYARNRLIDISRAAAEVLGIVQKGVSEVKMKILLITAPDGTTLYQLVDDRLAGVLGQPSVMADSLNQKRVQQ